jgi:hypothetical protein
MVVQLFAGGWHFTSRIADVEMVGDVSDHLLIDFAQPRYDTTGNE